jgi:hypothetical protein
MTLASRLYVPSLNSKVFCETLFASTSLLRCRSACGKFFVFADAKLEKKEKEKEEKKRKKGGKEKKEEKGKKGKNTKFDPIER